MATSVGGSIGAAIGSTFGPAGAIIGGLIGSLVGYAVDTAVAELLDKSVSQTSRDVGGAKVIAASEGDPITYAWGGVHPSAGGSAAGVRVAGAVLWSSDPYTVQNSSGSKKRGVATTSRTFVDVAIGFTGNFASHLDRVLSDGRVIYEAEPKTLGQFRVNNQEIPSPFGEAPDVILEYGTPILQLDAQEWFVTVWHFVVRHALNAAGVPHNPDNRLDYIRAGDLVTFTLTEPGGAVQTATVRCTQISTGTNGATSATLRIPDYSFNVTPAQPTFTSAQYPIWLLPYWDNPGQTGVTVNMTLSVVRPNWAPNTFRVSNPVEGVDWEYHPGYADGGSTPDLHQPSVIIENSEFGGLGDRAPTFPGRPVLYLKGLNVAGSGTRLPNLNAVLRCGTLCSAYSLLTEVMGMAGVPNQKIRPVPSALFIDPSVGGTWLTRAVGANLARRGASVLAADHQNATPQAVPGQYFTLGVFAPTGFATATYYRITHLEPVAGTTYNIYFTPQLDADYLNEVLEVHGHGAPFIDGFQIEGRTDLSEALQQVMVAYDLETRETAGTVEVFFQSLRDFVGVSPVHLDARGDGGKPAQPLKLEPIDELALPYYAQVTYLNTENAALTGASQDSFDGVRENPVSRNSLFALEHPSNPAPIAAVNLPNVTMTPRAASAVARRLLQRANEFTQRATLNLPAWYLRVQEGDVLKLSEIPDEFLPPDGNRLLYGAHWSLLVEQLDQGANGIIGVQAMAMVSDDLTPPPGVPRDDSDVRHENGPSIPNLFVFDNLPPLADLNVTDPGVYIILGSSGPGSAPTNVQAVTLLEDFDGSETWSAVRGTSAIAVVGGVVSAALLDASVATMDWTSSLSVETFNGALESVTELDCLGGANFMLIGAELVCFQTATLESDGTYTLTGFRRGLWGTGDRCATHTTNEIVVLLGHETQLASGIFHRPHTLGSVGRTVEYRGTAAGQSVDDAPGATVTGITLTCGRPLPVANLRWDKEADDLQLSWQRHPRNRWRAYSTEAPQVEKSEVYVVNFYKVGTGDLVRTITTADGVRSVTYTKTHMTDDGTDGDATITVTVERVSSATLNSHPRTVIADIADGPSTGGLDY